MLHERALLPARRVEILAGAETRTADPQQTIECKGVVRREVERNLDPLDGRFGVSLVQVDKSASAPGPRRAAIERERLADDQVRRLEVVKQSECVAENRKHCRVS